MTLDQNYLKRKIDNMTTYQFKNSEGSVSILIVTKLKSGYEVEFTRYDDFFRRTDGLKNMESVKNFIKDFTI